MEDNDRIQRELYGKKEYGMEIDQCGGAYMDKTIME